MCRRLLERDASRQQFRGIVWLIGADFESPRQWLQLYTWIVDCSNENISRTFVRCCCRICNIDRPISVLDLAPSRNRRRRRKGQPSRSSLYSSVEVWSACNYTEMLVLHHATIITPHPKLFFSLHWCLTFRFSSDLTFRLQIHQKRHRAFRHQTQIPYPSPVGIPLPVLLRVSLALPRPVATAPVCVLIFLYFIRASLCYSVQICRVHARFWKPLCSSLRQCKRWENVCGICLCSFSRYSNPKPQTSPLDSSW